MIYFTSDMHIGHDKEFIYKPRGFETLQEMETTIITNWNNTVSDEDTVYVLGDASLGDHEHGTDLLSKLNGTLNLIIGNHDTNRRLELYEERGIFKSIKYADLIKYKKFHFFISHYPAFTSNLEKEHLSQATLDLFGHTHSKEKFYNEIPFMYNVAMDAHNCTPVSVEEILIDMKNKVLECKEFIK